MTNKPTLTCAQHAEEIAKKFVGYKLARLKITCEHPAYALCVTYPVGKNNMLDIEFWHWKDTFQNRIEDALESWTLDKLTIIKIAPGYPSLNIKVEVVE